MSVSHPPAAVDLFNENNLPPFASDQIKELAKIIQEKRQALLTIQRDAENQQRRNRAIKEHCHHVKQEFVNLEVTLWLCMTH
jgi:molecular chaperone GrpE (heat shock protein)